MFIFASRIFHFSVIVKKEKLRSMRFSETSCMLSMQLFVCELFYQNFMCDITFTSLQFSFTIFKECLAILGHDALKVKGRSLSCHGMISQFLILFRGITTKFIAFVNGDYFSTPCFKIATETDSFQLDFFTFDDSLSKSQHLCVATTRDGF